MLNDIYAVSQINPFALNVVMLSIVMLSIVMLSVVMLSVVAPNMQFKSTPNMSVCGNAIRQLNVSLAI